MLPDFVRVKERRRRRFIGAVQHEAEKRTPLLNQVRTVQQHEGRRLQYDTVDGAQDVVAYDKKISTSLTVRLDTIAEMDNRCYAEKATAMAEEIAGQQMQQFFSMVEDSCKKAGTVTDSGGKPFDPRMLIESLEKVDIDFDQRGRPRLPTLVANPKDQPVFDKRLAEAEASPEFQRQWNALMQRKWAEWRDREADRKLVG